MVLAVLDPAGGVLRYTTCGHPAPLVIGGDGGSRFLPATAGGLWKTRAKFFRAA